MKTLKTSTAILTLLAIIAALSFSASAPQQASAAKTTCGSLAKAVMSLQRAERAASRLVPLTYKKYLLVSKKTGNPYSPPAVKAYKDYEKAIAKERRIKKQLHGVSVVFNKNC